MAKYAGMWFESTRGKSANAGFEKTLLSALADDGGLFLPTEFPERVREIAPDRERILNRILNRILAGDRATAA